MSSPILDWRDGQPYSTHYQDIYFSRASGLEETRHVFLAQNRLAERWAALPDDAVFTIGETGFGTGLNFLCAWQLWMRTAPGSARLHFLSAELHPILPADLRRALALWPELAAEADELLLQYHAFAPGWHRLAFARGRVVLTLLVGDAAETLGRARAAVDAWFLDGFAPARNPGMWTEALFAAVARLSARNASFATFTSAGAVRRGLQTVGFAVEKVAGSGSKRHILRGVLREGGVPPRPAPERSAVVIGGGLAGSATAASLAARGWRVTLIERHARLAAEASGNHQGILYARLSPRMSPLSEFTLAGYQYVLRALKRVLPEGEDSWRQCGLLQLGFDAAEAARLEGVAALGLPETLLYRVDRAQASAIAGVAVETGGLYFPEGGWVHPPALCDALTGTSGIEVRTGLEATELVREEGRWQVLGEQGLIAAAPVVIVACAAHTLRFAQTRHLPLRSIRGQITHVPATENSRALRAVLCTQGYAAPARNGLHAVGATYGNLEQALDVRALDNMENLSMLAQLAPRFHEALGGAGLQPGELQGRASCRCNVVDYLPLAGALGAEFPGLHLNTGHGSRGLVTAMLAAEAVAAELENEPAPIPEELMKALSPQRFNAAKR